MHHIVKFQAASGALLISFLLLPLILLRYFITLDLLLYDCTFAVSSPAKIWLLQSAFFRDSNESDFI